jgi:4-diphosphocytidyl-2-C-methyl-D-erythritol kinase
MQDIECDLHTVDTSMVCYPADSVIGHEVESSTHDMYPVLPPAGVTARYAVNLTKTVPHGAGLGGGSGNAATALWAANQLAGRPAKDADLLRWAGEIGSDISVFFSHGAAYCTGRGEIVENCSPPVDLKTRMLLVKPVESLPTPAIFKALDLRRCSTADPNILLESLRRAALVPQELCVNDLETPAFETLPALAELKESLIATGLYKSVFMTGSGSTMVCMGSDEVPEFVARNTSLFKAPARLIVRDPDGWYQALDDVELAAVA